MSRRHTDFFITGKRRTCTAAFPQRRMNQPPRDATALVSVINLSLLDTMRTTAPSWNFSIVAMRGPAISKTVMAFIRYRIAD